MPSNKEKILKKLFSLRRFGIKPGLERTCRLLNFCGNPHNNYPSIHVAGTNGKGSVCSIIASVLMEAGFKVGLYTSPHLLRFNERIKINGSEMTDEALVQIAEKLFPESEKIGCTFFEITSVLAFDWFSQNNVDIAIIEAGMGGRFDSTNVITPLISVIASIGLDHREYLGNTIESIALEKAGIIKQNVKTIVSENNPDINKILKEKALEKQSEIIFVKYKYNGKIKRTTHNLSIIAEIHTPDKLFEDLEIALAGEHQLKNTLTAVAALDQVKELFPFTEDNFKDGLKNVQKNTGIRGRLELIKQSPPLVLDAAHNLEAIECLVNTLQSNFDSKWNIVFGAMADKDISQMLRKLKLICSEFFLTSLKIERAIPINLLEKYADEENISNYNSFASVSEAVKAAVNTNKPVLITGSFYLLGEALEYINKIFADVTHPMT